MPGMQCLHEDDIDVASVVVLVCAAVLIEDSKGIDKIVRMMVLLAAQK